MNKKHKTQTVKSPIEFNARIVESAGGLAMRDILTVCGVLAVIFGMCVMCAMHRARENEILESSPEYMEKKRAYDAARSEYLHVRDSIWNARRNGNIK